MTTRKLTKTVPSEIQDKPLKRSVFSMISEENNTQDSSGGSQENLQPKRQKRPLSPADIEARKQSFELFKATKSWLEKTFPKTFNFKEPKLLKQGIQREILSVSSPFSKRQLRKSVGSYVNSKAYLKAMVKEKWRYDLNGEPVEEVTQAHKEDAVKRLEQRKNQVKQKRQDS